MNLEFKSSSLALEAEKRDWQYIRPFLLRHRFAGRKKILAFYVGGINVLC